MDKKKSAGEVAVSAANVHSNADNIGDGRLSAPSALRNRAVICDTLAGFVPASGCALEIASGTGQHVVTFAKRFPALSWQPSDIEPERLVSIDAWAAAEGGENIRAAFLLDASLPDWDIGRFDLVNVGNLFHLVSDADGVNIIAGAARALRPGGILFIYGPFRTSGDFRSQGDAEFHARIQAADRLAGYKDLDWMQEIAGAAGLTPLAQIEMPANNLSLVWQKPA